MNNHNMHLYTHIPTKKEERKYNKTLSDVLMLMVGLPIKIVSEEYHFTDEQCEELANHIISEYDAVQTDYADLTDSLEVLSEEANLLVSDIFKKYNLGKTRQDGAFYLVSGISTMKLMDKFGFTNDQCKDYADRLVKSYTYYCRGFITTYDLKQIVKKKTGIVMKRAN